MSTTDKTPDLDRSSKALAPSAIIRLDVVSDFICPWCYIGSERLGRAVSRVAQNGIDVRVIWRAFELNPDMPAEGMDRKAYRSARFGSWEHSQALDKQVAQAGTAEGLNFAYDRVDRTPNTRRAHRLARRALQEGGIPLQTEVVSALFRSYFDIGDDIGDPKTLVEIARKYGMEDNGLHNYFLSNEDEDAVIREETRSAQAGLKAVPSVLSGNLLLFSGAQHADDIARALQRVHQSQTDAGHGLVSGDLRRADTAGSSSTSIFS